MDTYGRRRDADEGQPAQESTRRRASGRKASGRPEDDISISANASLRMLPCKCFPANASLRMLPCEWRPSVLVGSTPDQLAVSIHLPDPMQRNRQQSPLRVEELE